jgi:hypothetical protein
VIKALWVESRFEVADGFAGAWAMTQVRSTQVGVGLFHGKIKVFQLGLVQWRLCVSESYNPDTYTS